MEIIDKYQIVSDGIKINVNIQKDKFNLIYVIMCPEITKPTLIFLNEIKKKLILEINITSAEISDQAAINEIKTRFQQSASKIMNGVMPGLNLDTKNFLIGKLMHEMLGLGDIEFLLEDKDLEEIVIVSSREHIKVYHKKYGWLETNLAVEKENQILNYANIIARRVGRQITTLNPLLDAHLVSGDRGNAVLYPISYKGNTITIRKFARDPWTVTDLIKNNTCSAEVFALLWLAIQYEMNILVSGGTASGKTSFLNVIMPFIPPNHRIISIEDTLELQLPKFLYWTPLTVRPPNSEGKGEIEMIDLLVNSLRMRPDRIIMGEIRKADQAEVLFEAMHTGHSVYATVHADSISETIRRLVNPPINVPPNLLAAVNLNVVLFRDRKKGIRRVHQVGEYYINEDGTSVSPNILYRWKPIEDKIVVHSANMKLFDELSTITGMTQQDIIKDLKNKEEILKTMVKKNIRELNEVGGVISRYYSDPKKVFKDGR